MKKMTNATSKGSIRAWAKVFIFRVLYKKMSKQYQAHLDWFKTAFTDDSSAEDIIEFIKRVFDLEKALHLDVVRSLETSIQASDIAPCKIDIKDALFLTSYIKDNLDKGDNGAQVIDRFVKDYPDLLKKYAIDASLVQRLTRTHLSKLSFPQIMQVLSVYEQKRNRQLVREADLRNMVKLVPSVVRGETVAAADMLNEMASLCATAPSKSEIKIQVFGPNDIRVCVDTASLLHNIREALRDNAESLGRMEGKVFNIEISNKLVRTLCGQL